MLDQKRNFHSVTNRAGAGLWVPPDSLETVREMVTRAPNQVTRAYVEGSVSDLWGAS